MEYKEVRQYSKRLRCIRGPYENIRPEWMIIFLQYYHRLTTND